MSEYQPKILLVDDLPQNLMLLEAVLKKIDAEIHTAGSGEEALKILEEHTFSLALLDVHMPGMDGFELASRISRDPDHTNMPIIFISANNLDEMSISQGYKAGAVDYIRKPFNNEFLISKVKVFIAMARQQIELKEQSERLEELFKEQMLSQKTISEQLKLEKSYSKVSGKFVGDFEADTSMRDALQIIGELIGASGAIMYDLKPVQNTFVPRVSWSQNGGYSEKDEINSLFLDSIDLNREKLKNRELVKNAAEVLAPATDFLMLPFHVFNQLQVILFFYNREYPLSFFDKFESTSIFIDLISSALERMEVHKKLRHTERLAGLGEIATGIAHELNQPLNTISLGLDNILLAVKSGKATEEYLDKKTKKIHDNILRTRAIIDHVRTFSRDQDGYINTEFNVNDSIRNAISLVSEQYSNHGISLESELDDNIEKPIGNTYKFEEVILNMLSNAMHAVDSRKEKEGSSYYGSIRVLTYQQKKNIFVEVKDNGCGIPEHILNKIMQPFFTTKEEGKGTGLGLSIAFGIIKDMNGTIDIESTVGSGTNVRVVIPVNN